MLRKPIELMIYVTRADQHDAVGLRKDCMIHPSSYQGSQRTLTGMEVSDQADQPLSAIRRMSSFPREDERSNTGSSA